jgi:hypothetical protein
MSEASQRQPLCFTTTVSRSHVTATAATHHPYRAREATAIADREERTPPAQQWALATPSPTVVLSLPWEPPSTSAKWCINPWPTTHPVPSRP